VFTKVNQLRTGGDWFRLIIRGAKQGAQILGIPKEEHMKIQKCGGLVSKLGLC
jgi:hypothetical protein